jgi:hypothetical protein
MPGVVGPKRGSSVADACGAAASPLRPIPGFLNEHYLYMSKRDFILGTEKTTIKNSAALECSKSFSKYQTTGGVVSFKSGY